MVAELLSVGTELLLGNIVNTNANYLAKECASLGLSCYHQVVVGDNPERLKETLITALERSDVVIMTGGLGPTDDDLSKETAAGVCGLPLILDEHSKEMIADYFERVHAGSITNNNWKQAMIPEGAIVLDNHNGTAPGVIIETDNKAIILLPGPPGELKPMFAEHVAPYLAAKQPEQFYSKMVKLCGIGESSAETKVKDLIDEQTNPTLAPYAKIGEVHFRVTAKAKDAAQADALMEPLIKELYHRFGKLIFTTDPDETLEEVVVKLLKAKGYTLATAESCTGGLLSGRLINVAGISEVFKEGFVTYANEAKMRSLGVKEETLAQYGAVSKETAREMSEGVCQVTGADVGISVTGIAGPDGGTKEKPVGLVYIGCTVKGKTRVEEFFFTGNRKKNRDYAVVRALTLLREEIL
ncbi:competence/damage-inducible protein A [Ohessyouella blattaphilus]|uniref:Putative competence-damage inducible protein n=1 Tax=Ohessyouella blattaphilus TaxID=2949333 RepID=A0ABT1EFA8_9FIRM|nr:competence/damage-inducible protein A [Ohessyouella blattaphilus]MCP1109375.1 competence/damage-inducible protein A [Ohessyouella blattaphilus]MCR8562769.1 competence/damage-inducible protein A [Ohessyouella blattaphilus]MDL2249320.1 competence/damage-inducible protein A [Lachnospiraceae bacterium OttesenSCG-928-J05]